MTPGGSKLVSLQAKEEGGERVPVYLYGGNGNLADLIHGLLVLLTLGGPMTLPLKTRPRARAPGDTRKRRFELMRSG